MSRRVWIWVLMSVSLIVGTVAGRVPAREPLMAGGYRVVSADFHTHSAFWSDGALSPFGLVLAARAQGLDALAITAHNEVIDAQAGRGFASWVNRVWSGLAVPMPIVIVGQELIGSGHVIALGTEQQIGLPDMEPQLAEVHRQGGFAIAAHPMRAYWPGFTDAARAMLDGSELCHPVVFSNPKALPAFEEFAKDRAMTAIGSSDFHYFGRMGTCRTYVFATDNTAPAIMEALRARRTVVYGPGGRTYGDPALAALISDRPDLRRAATEDPPASALDWVSRAAGLLGVFGMVLATRRRSGV